MEVAVAGLLFPGAEGGCALSAGVVICVVAAVLGLPPVFASPVGGLVVRAVEAGCVTTESGILTGG